MRCYQTMALILLLCVISGYSTHSALADAEAKSIEANVIAKGHWYLIHILPRSATPAFPFGLSKRFGVPKSFPSKPDPSAEPTRRRCLL